MLRRAGWSISDQALSSFTNFLLAVLAARSLDPQEFGGFAIALATYLIAVGIVRAVCAEPLIVRHSVGSARSEAERVLGATLLLAVGGGLALVGAGAVFGAPVGPALLALGLSLPGLLLQEVERYWFVAEGRPAGAFVVDAVWTVTQLVGIFVLVSVTTPTVGGFVGVWGAAATFSAIVGLVAMRVVPRPGAAIGWLASSRDLWPRYLGEFASTMGAWQATLFLLGGLAGLASLGAVRGAQVLFGPLHVVFYGARLVVVPEGARADVVGRRSVVRTAVAAAAALGGITVVWTAVVVVLPDRIGTALLGDTWAAAHDIALPFGAFMTTEAVVFGASIGLRLLADARSSLRAASVAGTSLVVVVAVLASRAPLGTTVWAMVAVGALGIVVWWRALVRSAHHRSASSTQTTAEAAGEGQNAPGTGLVEDGDEVR